MRLAFFGTPRFAHIVLRSMIEAGLVPAVVFCNPDRPIGRKKTITAPPVKALAQNHGIPVEQPEILTGAAEVLQSYRPEVAVVAAYAKIIPEKILAAAPKGFVGVHPSLLPLFRGSSPIQSAILNGAAETGTSIYILDKEMDHGPVIARKAVPLTGAETYPELEQSLAELGGALLSQHLAEYVGGALPPVPQNHSLATYTNKFETADAYIAPELLQVAASGKDSRAAEDVFRRIRAFYSEPGAWTEMGGVRTKLLRAKLEDGRLMLLLTQAAGQKPREVRG